MVSVIIPALNEAANIGRCLEALTRQTISEPFEVIVVDNGSTDDTAEVAESFKDRLAIRVTREHRRGRGRARARGCQEAKGTVLFGMDAETVVDPEWINRTLRVFAAEPETAAVTHGMRIHDCRRLTNITHNQCLPVMLWLYRFLHGHWSISGGSFAVRRDAYEAAGGFDPLLDAMEDVDLGERIAQIGRIRHLPRPAVLISGRRFRRGFFRGWFEYIRSYCEVRFFKRKMVELPRVE